jgi:hypothetical protein
MLRDQLACPFSIFLPPPAVPTLRPAMFDALKAHLGSAAEKLSHLRRFL